MAGASETELLDNYPIQGTLDSPAIPRDLRRCPQCNHTHSWAHHLLQCPGTAELRHGICRDWSICGKKFAQLALGGLPASGSRLRRDMQILQDERFRELFEF